MLNHIDEAFNQVVLIIKPMIIFTLVKVILLRRKHCLLKLCESTSEMTALIVKV
jgi:hypothetical protein